MAFATASASHTSLLNTVTEPFVTLGNLLTRLRDIQGRNHDLHALLDMSDVELERRGLKRENVVRHVFSGFVYS